MGTIRFVALGAGQDVGRSCVVVTLGGRTVMFDCGMHMGYVDERRFPDFTLLAPGGEDLSRIIDCVIITHFHLDHCGALPYLTEMCGYTGPIFMTHPTRGLCPILLEDFRRITVEKRGESNFFTAQMIQACMQKVIPLNVLEGHAVGGDPDFVVRPYYAGHVLGAAMFHVRVGSESVLYTGDYNMTPDRHLGAAEADLALRPDVLITESTYATTLRDSKRARERDFLKNIHQCVAAGGKVLIPVFALGRVQELCILVEAYWERHGLQIPVYFSAGMAEAANAYYRSHIGWTNERGVEQLPVRNMFDFHHVKQFERHFADAPGPMVLFSSPGMLHSGKPDGAGHVLGKFLTMTGDRIGTSLEIFKKWCGDERNLLIIPGFCVSGTVGAKVLAGQRRVLLSEWMGAAAWC